MMTLGYMLLNNKNEFVKISFSSTGKMLKKKINVLPTLSNILFYEIS